jgi:hypothetical protein
VVRSRQRFHRAGQGCAARDVLLACTAKPAT